MELHKARANAEIDDLLSVLRCGTGKEFDLDKLRFEKIIATCDADADGLHIELLLTSFFHEHLIKIIEAGRFYIALSPLYKVSITGKPHQYFNDELALSKFYSSELSEIFKFVDDKGKSIKNVPKYIKEALDYHKSLKIEAEKLNIEPKILENVFVLNYDRDTDTLDLDERITLSELNNDKTSISGFYTDHLGEDYFVGCVVDESFTENLAVLQDKFISLTEGVSILTNKGNEIETSSLHEKIDLLLTTVKKNARVSRLKGLGEMNDDELWDTALNPETRRLVQVTLVEDSDEVVKAFMGKSPEKRKEFLKEVFDSAIREAEEV
jgi:DNA gyrase subunit B